MSEHRTPTSSRKGIRISAATKELYAKRDKKLDSDPETRPLPPEQWAKAMRRSEFFDLPRPISPKS